MSLKSNQQKSDQDAEMEHNGNSKLPNVFFKDGANLLRCVDEFVEIETDNVLSLNLNFGDDDQDDDSDSERSNKADDFIETSYEKLWEQMLPVNDGKFVRKTILTEGVGECIQDDAAIKVHYIGFREYSNEPIASSNENVPEIIIMKEDKHLTGFMMALRSMKVRETSRFLMSHKVMYGESGCPPLIPPKAMCLFTIEVVDTAPINTRSDSETESQTTFQKVYKVARDTYVKGVFFFKKMDYNLAIKAFREAIKLIEFCRLEDEFEEQKQEKFLSKIYLSLSICYNKQNRPFKACCMSNNLAYIGYLWNNSKALLHNARSLAMIGEYGQAEKRLLKAKSLDPDCPQIIQELEKVQKKKGEHEQNLNYFENSISFQSKKTNQQSDKVVPQLNDNFVDSTEKYMKFFKDNEQLYKTNLPPGLTKHESDVVKDMAKKYNFHCLYVNDIVVSLSKIEIDDKFEVNDA